MKAHLKLIIFFAALCLASTAALILMNRAPVSVAEITVDGRVVRRVDLSVDAEFDVEAGGGFNHISVRGGKIAVTDADCPDRLCVRRGYVSGGVPIVCLPHRLTVKTDGGVGGGVDGGVDAVAGR